MKLRKEIEEACEFGVAAIIDGSPEQTIQEEWTKFIDNGGYTYGRYKAFLAWANCLRKSKETD
jgi:hypothetical protein